MIQAAVLRLDAPPSWGDETPPSFLNPAEWAVLGPRAVAKRRRDFCRGRLISKLLVANQLGGAVEDILVLPRSTGAPAAYNRERLALSIELSLSHTERFAAAALGPTGLALGIDVEQRIENASLIARDYFTDRELHLCQDGAEIWLATVIWTLKEAMLKILQTGLRDALQSVQVLEIQSDEDSNRGTAKVFIESRPEQEYRGWWRVIDSAVVGIVSSHEQGEPEFWICDNGLELKALSK